MRKHVREAVIAGAALLLSVAPAFANATYFRQTTVPFITLPPTTDRNNPPFVVVLSVNVPPGNWAISAKAEANNNADTYDVIQCEIFVQNTEITRSTVTNGTGSAQIVSMPLMAAVKTTQLSTPISLECFHDNDTSNQTIDIATMLIATTPVLK